MQRAAKKEGAAGKGALFERFQFYYSRLKT